MVSAQKWLDMNYPKEQRSKREKLNISGKKLEGPLNLEGFVKLEELDCSFNLITRLEGLDSCKKKLVRLDVSNNFFNTQDLNYFSHFTNLKRLYIGTTDQKRIKRDIYNRFVGSLEPLKGLSELKELSVSNTDIDGGLEHLRDNLNLERMYCYNSRGEKADCKKIRKELKSYLKKDYWGKEYYELRNWRIDQKGTNQKAMTMEVSFPSHSFSPLVITSRTKNAQKWLNENYPKKERSVCAKLDFSSSEIEIGEKLEGSLDLTDFKDLKLLNCSGHQITKLKLGVYPYLEDLYCDKNKLTVFNIKNYPVTKLDCSDNQLRELTINDCPQLAELFFSNNLLTSFNFNTLDKTKLVRLKLSNNRLSRCSLSKLVPFVNLELVDIGSNDQKKIDRGFYNHFHDSLKSLKNMTKLKHLNIEATDIDGGLEYLPQSLEKFYCTSYGTLTKVGNIEEILKKYPDSVQTQTSSTSQFISSSEAITLLEVKKEKINLSNPLNYFGHLQRWRKDNHGLIQAVKENDDSEVDSYDEEILMPSLSGYNNGQQTKQVKLAHLIQKTKNKIGSDLVISLEALLDTQSEIAKDNSNYTIRKDQREAKEKLQGKLSLEEIDGLCQLQSEVIQLEQQMMAQIQINPIK